MVDSWYRCNRYYSSNVPFFLRRDQVGSGSKRFVFIRIVCTERIRLVRVRFVWGLLRRRCYRRARTSKNISRRCAVLIRTRTGSAIHHVVGGNGGCRGLWLVVRWIERPGGWRRLLAISARGRSLLDVGGMARIDRVWYGILRRV